jgi:2-polyprenyl-6-methoxyphenol hydroxylase-like FAD-dependent oxidoreductase
VVRVAIVGFGIGGGALAVALARDDQEVTVFEQTPSPGPVGAGFLLQPSGQAALASLGLLDRVAAEAWPIRAFHAESAPGRTLTLMRYDRHDPARFALGVARGRLFTTLMDAATSAGVRVVTGARIVDARETRDAVAPLDEHDGEHESFDVLVGADGMRSALRRRVDPGSRLFLSPHAALWGLGRFDGPCPQRLRQQARGVRILAGLLPVGEREMACFWGLRAADLDALRAEGFEALVQRMDAVFPEARCVLEDIGGFDRLALARYGHATLARRYTGRIVLLGDAAHPSPPHLGQGANLALLDAVALADALRRERRPSEAFACWDRQRRWQNARYAYLSRALSPFFQSSHGWLGPARDLALPAMGAVPPLRAFMEHVLAGRG